MNELSIPEVGVGPEGQFSVKCGNREFTIRYVCNIRTGANLAMIRETIQHFKHAIQIVASGLGKVSSKLPERAAYIKNDVHSDACVSVWTRNSFAVVPDFKNGHIYKVPVNICNEYTSAQMLVNQLWLAAEGMGDNFDDCMAAGSIIDVNTSKTSKKGDPAKEFAEKYFEKDAPVDLAKEFPRQPPPQPQATPQQPEGAHPLARKSAGGKVEITHLGDYVSKLQEEYEKEFAGSGKWISFDVSKLWWHMPDKTDGSGSYECIDVYGFFNGMPSQYPMQAPRMFPPLPESQFPGNWENLFKNFIHEGQLSKLGDVWEQAMVISWGLSISKKNGKTYWNLKSVEPAGVYASDNYTEPEWANEEPPWSEDDEVNEADVDFMG